MKRTCNICADTQTHFVSCKKCNFEACVKCTKTFILDPSRPSRASCMNCKVEWTKKDLVDSFSIGFVLGKYKEHRENLLFEFEKALLPDTMEIAFRVKKTRELTLKIAKIEADISEINRNYVPLRSEHDLQFNLDLMNEIHKLNKQRYRAQFELSNVNPEHRPRNKATPVAAKRYFPCVTTDCRGYIGMSNWTCQMCNVIVCEHCMEPTGTEHVCNEDTVNTVKMIKSDSKNCPKCMASIYRISGCPQMFCTICHTAFDWVTGNIVDRGIIHNPHYFEYLRTHQADTHEDNRGCDADVSYTAFIRKFPKVGGRDSEYPSIFQNLAHIEHVYLPHIRPTEEILNTNLDLRIKYILKEITIDKFKSELHKKEKAREKKKEIYDIMTMYLTAAKDIIRRVYGSSSCEGLKAELHELREYTNKSLEDNVERIFKCAIPRIQHTWTTVDYYRY